MARQVLQQMVQEQLIEQYAAKNNIVVTSADIAAKEDTIKANFPAGSWDRCSRRAAYRERRPVGVAHADHSRQRRRQRT